MCVNNFYIQDYEENQLSWELREAQLEKQLEAITTTHPSTTYTSAQVKHTITIFAASL